MTSHVPCVTIKTGIKKEGEMYYIGIDLGTSATKLMLVTESGEILNAITKEYPLYFVHLYQSLGVHFVDPQEH